MALAQALQIVSKTDPGRVRSHNEDCVESRPELGIVVLADGMGGYNAGEVASGMATSLIAEGLGSEWRIKELGKLDRSQTMALCEKVVRAQIAKANTAIFEAAQKDPQCAGMGTTLVVGVFYDNYLAVAHIGDSRLYRMRGDVLEQVTRDHSLLQEQIDSGLISKEDARLSHNKNLVTKALGIDPEVEPEFHIYETQPGDVYLLCSDGLNDMIEDEEIQMTLIALRSNLELTAQQLIQSANDNGGRDNVSVIMVKVLSSFAVERGWLARLKSLFS